jgi:hypothetical protein
LLTVRATTDDRYRSNHFDALEKHLFFSIRELNKLTCVSTPVHRHLMQLFGFVMKHLRSVPHGLTPARKAERVTPSSEELRQLRCMKHQSWQSIIILDESWFSLSAYDEQV